MQLRRLSMRLFRSFKLLPLLGLMFYSSVWANTAPTLVSYTEVSWTSAGLSKSTAAAVSWNSGDIIVVAAGSEGPDTIGTPTASGLTFTSKASNTTGATCGTQIAAATAGSTSSAVVTVTINNSSDHWGFGVWVWRSSGGIGNVAEQHTSTKTVSLTPAGGADSGIVYATFDFNADAITGISITPSPTNTRQEVADTSGAPHYTIYVADLDDQVSSAAVSYGISGGTGSGPFSIVALEIKGTTGGGGATPIAPQLSILGVH